MACQPYLPWIPPKQQLWVGRVEEMHPHSNGEDVVSLGSHLNLARCYLMRKVAQGVHGWRNGWEWTHAVAATGWGTLDLNAHPRTS